MSFPITTSPSEYAQYKIIINGQSWKIYNAEGNLEVSGTNNNFWSFVQDNGKDIRVFDNSGNQMYFWIEGWDYSNQKAVIWVKLPAGSTELNIAYGNPSATKSSYENPEQVFEFFDDFEGTELDTTKWSGDVSYVEVANGELHGLDSSAWHAIFHEQTGNALGKIVEAKAKITSVRAKPIVFGDGTRSFQFSHESDGGDRFMAYDGSTYYYSEEEINENVYDIYKIIVFEDGSCKFVNSLAEKLSADFTTLKLQNTGTLYIELVTGSSYWDWIRVYKLADPADFGTPTVKTFEDPPDAPLLGDKRSDPKYYAYRLERVTEFDYITGQDYSIVSVYLNDIGFNSTQTVLLDAYGEIYTLTITATAEGFMGAWKNFTVTLTYPNGSVKTWNSKTFDLSSLDYDVKIQYWVQQADSWLDLDIYIGGLLDFQVLPFGTEFDLNKFVLFNRVQGTSTKEMNVDIFYVANKDWHYIVQKGESPFDWGGLTDAIKDTPGNIWNQFLGLVEQIPVAGDYLADGLDFMAILVGESFFYIKLFFVENWEITVLTFEAFAMMYAMQSRSIFTMFRRYYHFHEAALLLMFNIIKETLNLIWRLIQAVGSLIPFT